MRVCILGDGLSSLTLAKALVNQKIYVEIFTDKKKQILNQSRTIGITKNNIRYFNENILNINKIIWPLKKIEIFTENLEKEELLKFEDNHDQLFSIVKNSKLFEALEKSLNKNKYFKIISKQKKSLNYKDYDLVINLDFSNYITKKYFSNKITKKYNNYAYVGLFRHKKINNVVASQVFTKIGPLAFLPVSNIETSFVYSVNKNLNLTRENLISLISKYNHKYKIKLINKINSFDLLSLNLRSYYHKNILAFGDLIHKIHPLAGQGFNMTIRDIKILMQIIKNKQDLGLTIDISVNEEFENNMRHKNLIFSSGIDLIYEFFNLERKIKSKILSKSIQFAGNQTYINNVLKNIADSGIA